MKRVFMFAGGGSGGHLFPALAIYEEIRDIDRDASGIFLCSERPLDAAILSRAGVPFERIPARPASLRPVALARFIRSWGGAVRAARRAIRCEKLSADAVHLVAMGGFVAAPCARAARAERVPVTLVNLDAVPGKANRWIARRAAYVVSSAHVQRSGWPVVPPIVRAAARSGHPRAECRRLLGLDPARPTLLVTGASQGARSINRLVVALLARERRAFDPDWQVIHQTGAGDDEYVRQAYRDAGVPAVVEPFMVDMGPAWGAADLAVSRAGAGSVGEAWANATPTVFLPYPYHRDRHQRFNAELLEHAGGAVIVEDRIDELRNLSGAGRVIVELMADPAAREDMRSALIGLGPADGARQIARVLLDRSIP
jgi:UDP-N-acetylglucosamine--N-acetylmuramyl-(pentapeptide) pyrophosphoryl-undecaprenol N-acetylglucosamine transferase